MRNSIIVACMLIATDATAEVKSGDRVLLMGDSEAFLLSQEFPAMAAQDGVTFKAAVVPGSSVIQWSEHLAREWSEVFRFKPTVIFVALGANDACMGKSVVANEQIPMIPGQTPFIVKVVRRLHKTKAREVYWLGPPKIGAAGNDKKKCLATVAVPGLEAFANMIRATDIPYLDAREIQVDMWEDKLHCSRPATSSDPRNGCLVWARWVWDRVKTP